MIVNRKRGISSRKYEEEHMTNYFLELAEKLDEFQDRHKTSFTIFGVTFVATMVMVALNLEFQWVDLSDMFK